jgi:hypothetical protein
MGLGMLAGVQRDANALIVNCIVRLVQCRSFVVQLDGLFIKPLGLRRECSKYL